MPLACPAHVSKYVLKQPRGSFSGSGEKVHPPPPKLSCTEFVLTTYGQINCNLLIMMVKMEFIVKEVCWLESQ